MSAPVTTRVEETPAVTALRSKDLLGIADLTPEEMVEVEVLAVACPRGAPSLT